MQVFLKKFLIIIFSIFSFSNCSKNIRPLGTPVPSIRVRHEGKVIVVPLEKYVAHVLNGEVPKNWPLQALMAQAIAIRTFALKKIKERKKNNFDVDSTVMDQVYKKNSENIFIKAAKDTEGLVVTIDSALAETSFHSTCGGHTASAKTVWGTAHKHLHGVKCGYCQSSPSFLWKKIIPLATLENIFNQKIDSINLIGHTSDGRAKKIEFLGSKNNKIDANQFRMKVGPTNIKSTLIKKIHIDKDQAIFFGHGFGHGVGLCQYGALGMAKQGKNALAILEKYYPGTKIKRAY